MSNSTKQEKRKGKGNPNPSPATRFGGERGNPQSPGGWKKEDSISYQYNLLMRMSPEELDEFIPKTVAQKIALQRVKTASTAMGLNDTKEITDRTEGKASQSIDLTTGGEKLNVALVQFVDGDSTNSGQDTD